MSNKRMDVYQVITWLLILSMDSALCSNSTAITGTPVSEYPLTNEANQRSDALSDLSMVNTLEPSNSYDVSHQVTTPLQFESLSSTEKPQESSTSPDEIRNSLSYILEGTFSEQTTVANGISETTQSVLSGGTLETCSSIPSELLADSITLSLSVTESSTQLVEPSSALAESEPVSFETSLALAESEPVSFETSLALAESEPVSFETSLALAEPSQSPAQSPSTLLTSLSTVPESLTDFLETSSNLAEPAQTPVESPSTLLPSLSTVIESPTDFLETSPTVVESISVLDSEMMSSNNVNGLNVSAPLLQSNELLTVTEFTDTYVTDLTSPSMQTSSDYTSSWFLLMQTNSPFSYFTSVETTMSLESENETNTVFLTTLVGSNMSDMVLSTAEESYLIAESLEPTTIPETATTTFLIYDSSSGFDSLTLNAASESNLTMEASESTTNPETATTPFLFYDSSSGFDSLTLNAASDSSNLTMEVSEPTTLPETATTSFLFYDSSSGFDSSTFSAAFDSKPTTEIPEPTTHTEHETLTSLLPFYDSISESNSLTVNSASAFETTTVTSPDTASLMKPTESGFESLTAPHLTVSVPPTTKTPNSSSVVTSRTSQVTESSTSEQNLPAKSSSGLSTGGKVAIGILVPLAVIGFIILGVFIYRRYNWSRGGFKNFLQPGVHYRAYTNETFTDDDVSLGGSWRKMSES